MVQMVKKNSPTFRGLSAKIYKGEFVAILGGNGTGKQSMSLISALTGLIEARFLYRQQSEHKTCSTAFYVSPRPQSLFC